MYHGIVNVYKEKGFTSHDVVAKARGIFEQKKIGHTGTLDPDATGVLPICLGAGTKLCDMLTDKTKEYHAHMRLGLVTDTQDITGQIVETCEADQLNAITEEEMRCALNHFLGDYEQVPPMYSALKVNGKKLYELARAGIEVERQARSVHIYEIRDVAIDEAKKEMDFIVHCSKGTYIRTLCHDVGQLLGVGGVMLSLERTRVGIFKKESAYTLGELQALKESKQLDTIVTPVEAMFTELPETIVKPDATKFLQNGNMFRKFNVSKTSIKENGQTRVYDAGGKFYGIYNYQSDEQIFKPEKMFFV